MVIPHSLGLDRLLLRLWCGGKNKKGSKSSPCAGNDAP